MNKPSLVTGRYSILSISIFCCCFFSASGQNGPQQSPSSPLISRQPVIDSNAKAVVFAPGMISTPFNEAAASFTPDGKTVYFLQGTIYNAVCYSKLVNGKWTKPRVASFSGLWSDWDPFVTSDGKRLFFVSNRPLEGTSLGIPKRGSHLLYVDQISEDKWSVPRFLDVSFNVDSANNYAPTVSRSGSLFFCSRDRDGHAGMASFYAKWLGDRYDKPQFLALLGKEETSDPFISPDERYIIFVSGNDLYISYRQGDGWSAGEKLSTQVNNGDSNFDPTVSPDGKTLYYASSRVQGFYKRDQKGKPLDYEALLTEMHSIFNGQPNILMIPVNLHDKLN